MRFFCATNIGVNLPFRGCWFKSEVLQGPWRARHWKCTGGANTQSQPIRVAFVARALQEAGCDARLIVRTGGVHSWCRSSFVTSEIEESDKALHEAEWGLA